MNSILSLNENGLTLREVKNFIFGRVKYERIEMNAATLKRVADSEKRLHALLEKKIPIYGVTTGFGDSSFRFVQASQSEQLQENLVDYLSCGTGAIIPEAATRAAFLFRLNSLSRGYSGVSVELLERMQLYLQKNWIPVTPREGSLGASGDLIPLAYLAAILQGKGQIHGKNGQKVEMAATLAENKMPPYRLKTKEGLALVNGTSSMAGLAFVNLNHAHFLLETATLTTSWMCMALKGRTEAFDVLVNEKAKHHPGQTRVAKKIRHLLDAENYRAEPLHEGPVQDRYSIRCAPQVLGPVLETIEQGWQWLELEINSVSDNPLIGEDGSLSMGGNFYGGYLAHSMDYLKICVAHLADLLDRQLTLLMDDRQNRGLPPNLANWANMPEEKRFLHHGLKGLHQSVNAITSEIMAKAIPNGIFSRSSETHNQDKVSLGMSAAVQCSEMIEQMFNLQAMVLICAAQALDLRKISLLHPTSQALYQKIRQLLPFVAHDQVLGPQIETVVKMLKQLSISTGEEIIQNEKT